MRSRERLAEVMRTVNGRVVWPALQGHNLFDLYIDALLITAPGLSEEELSRLKHIATAHWSPHIRELAAEALNYLTETNND